MNPSTAIAPSNLAFVKYWGKKDPELRLPYNNSISVNLSNATTITSVNFVSDLERDKIISNEKEVSLTSNFAIRVSKHLDRLRSLAGENTKAIVKTENSFPESVGIASSASGFAALTAAAAGALGLDLDERELSILARLGSGSACRSIPDGFVEWVSGDDSESSFAKQIAPPDHWDISIVTVVVSQKAKKLTSTSGHELALASPFFKTRIDGIEDCLKKVRKSILSKDFEQFGQELEMEAISLHAIAMTSPFMANGWNSGAYYWTSDTMELILAVQEWRSSGLETYFTLDAGPTVHLVCLREYENEVINSVKELTENKPNRHWDIMVNHPANGVRLLSKEEQKTLNNREIKA